MPRRAPERVGRTLRRAIGGLLGGGLAGALDGLLVLAGTGAFWRGPLEILEPVALLGALGAVGAAALGAAADATGLGARAGAALLAAVSFAAGGLAVMGVHLFDVGIPIESRDHPAAYLPGLGAVLVAALVLGLLLRRAEARWPATKRALALGAALALLVPTALLEGARAAAAYREAARVAKAPPAGADALPDLFLLVLDTTRADALSSYGSPRRETPQLDRVAREGLRFRRAYAPDTWTAPSHASLFTGVYPSFHGTYAYHTALAADRPTLAGALAAQGYASLFVSTKEVLLESQGWARGFETAVTLNVEDRADFAYRRLLARAGGGAEATARSVELVNRWVDAEERGGRPLFVFLNVNDPHVAYLRRAPFYAAYAAERSVGATDPARLESLARDQNVGEAAQALTPDEAFLLRARYDSEVAAMDESLGVLFERLRQRRRGRPVVLAVVADHGELLGEHDLLYHGKYPYQPLVRVPLLLWSDPSLGRGVREDLASLLDVAPTFLALAGAAPAALPSLQGRDLLHGKAPDVVFAEQWGRLPPLAGRPAELMPRKAAITRDWKLVWGADGKRSLFRLGPDGEEAAEPEAEAAVERPLESALRRRFDLPASGPASASVPVDEATRRRLEALGYLR
jgi:arylsulfatase A-like enzyme